MKKLIILACFLTLIFPTLCLPFTDNLCHKNPPKIGDSIVQNAIKYLHIREANNNNRGPEIDAWHKVHKIPFGNPYCQMFCNIQYLEVFKEKNIKVPYPKKASVSDFAKWSLNQPLTAKVISTKSLAWGVNQIQPGDIASWKHGKASNNDEKNFYYGHAGLVDYVDKKGVIHTIEGNTKPTDKGDQQGRQIGNVKSGLDGVYKRERSINLNSNFPILYFIRIRTE